MRRTSENDPVGRGSVLDQPDPPNGPFQTHQVPHSTLVPSARSVPTLMGLINALKQRWVLAVCLGLLIAAAAAIGHWFVMSQGNHQVQALLDFLPDQSSVVYRAVRSDEQHEAFKQNQRVLITSRSLLNRVVQRPNVAELSILNRVDDAARLIEGSLLVRWVAPDLMSIVMNGDKPEELKTILDETIHLFLQESAEQLRRDRTEHKEKLLVLRRKYQQQIDEIANDFKKRNELNIAFTPDTVRVSLQQCHDDIRFIKGHLIQAEAKYQSDLKWIESIRTERESNDRRTLTDEEIDRVLRKETDTALVSLQQAVDAAESRLAGYRNSFVDPNHPKIKEAQGDLATLREKRQSLAKQRLIEIEKTLRSDRREELTRNESAAIYERDKHKSEIDSLKNQLLQQEFELGRLNNHAIEIEMQHERLKTLTEQVRGLDHQIREIHSSLDTGVRVRVREAAAIRYNHNLPRNLLDSSLSGGTAFLTAILLIAFLEWRARRVNGADQIANETSLRVLGTIPAFPSRQSIATGEADANPNWRSLLNESVSSARAMLLHTAKTRNMQIIMVTSAVPGEGKTALSSQIATSVATTGLRTLIVDCDLRNPSIHRLFDLPLAPGCSEILLSELDVTDVVQPTSVPNLWVVSAGHCSNRVIAAMAQGHPLESFFNRLRGQFDFIVVDTGPVLPVADSLVIGQHVDGALISIFQSISRLPNVLNATGRLGQVNIPLMGAVLNGVKSGTHDYSYNYVKQLPA